MKKATQIQKFAIYIITNDYNNHCYVGSAEIKWLKHRKNNHFNKLKANTHHSFKLQGAYRKYGVKALKFSILETNEGNWIYRNERETFWIEKFDSFKNGYNCTEKASHSRKLTIEEKKNLSLITKKQYFLGIRKTPNPKGLPRDKVLMNAINKQKKKTVYQYSLTLDFIKEWESTSDASRILCLSRTGILNCLHGYSKSSGNYIWKYKKL